MIRAKLLPVLIAVFAVLPLSQHAFSTEACSDVALLEYYKVGSPGDPASEKIYRFIRLRDALRAAIEAGEVEKGTCLNELYKSALKEEGEYWGTRMVEAGCDHEKPAGECQDPEIVRSVRFINTLNGELEGSLREGLAVAEAVKPACPPDQQDPFILTGPAKEQMCCGTADGKELGAVRTALKGDDYQTCLRRVRPSPAKGYQTAATCVGVAVWSFAKSIVNSLTSLITAPMQLVSAKGQLWQLITNKKTRYQFMSDLINSITESLNAHNKTINVCLNPHEQAKYVCRGVGDLAGFLASPLALGKILKMLGTGLKMGASVIDAALQASPGGKAAIAGMVQTNKAASAAMLASKTAAKGAAKGAGAPGLRSPGLKTAVAVAAISTRTRALAQKAIASTKTFAQGIKDGAKAAIERGVKARAAKAGPAVSGKSPLKLPKAANDNVSQPPARPPRPDSPFTRPVPPPKVVAAASEAGSTVRRTEIVYPKAPTRPQAIVKPTRFDAKPGAVEPAAPVAKPAAAPTAQLSLVEKYAPKINELRVQKTVRIARPDAVQKELGEIEEQMAKIREALSKPDLKPGTINANVSRYEDLANKKADLEEALRRGLRKPGAASGADSADAPAGP